LGLKKSPVVVHESHCVIAIEALIIEWIMASPEWIILDLVLDSSFVDRKSGQASKEAIKR